MNRAVSLLYYGWGSVANASASFFKIPYPDSNKTPAANSSEVEGTTVPILPAPPTSPKRAPPRLLLQPIRIQPVR